MVVLQSPGSVEGFGMKDMKGMKNMKCMRYDERPSWRDALDLTARLRRARLGRNDEHKNAA
jgi:hypothetical protein